MHHTISSPVLQDWLYGTLLGLGHSLLVSFVNQRVPGPYMDEIFHISQTWQYCNGNWNQWDPMITTPPALYLIAAFFRLCDGHERFLNSGLVPFCFVGLCRLRRKYLHDRSQVEASQSTRLTALAILLLPVLWDTSLLFYTDLLSLTAVLWALGSACPFPSFLAFLVALFTRQTNVVWIGFHCLPFGWNVLQKTIRCEITPTDALALLLRRLGLHALLICVFISFVIWNGGIVLGDRSAHQPVFHASQLFYFFAFTAFSALPLMLEQFFREVPIVIKNPVRFCLSLVLVSLLALCSVLCCTQAHPYLLADNRHFTFYIWRRLNQFSCVPYALVPAYAISAILMWRQSQFTSWEKITFLIVSAFSLIPAKLLEFRYFIVPFAVWRLSLAQQRPTKPAIWMELALHSALNIMAIWLFIERPFRWPSEPHKWQRFMW